MKSTRIISKERRPGSKKGEKVLDFWKHTRKRRRENDNKPWKFREKNKIKRTQKIKRTKLSFLRQKVVVSDWGSKRAERDDETSEEKRGKKVTKKR